VDCDAVSLGDWFSVVWKITLPSFSRAKQSTKMTLQDEETVIL
jgi:hypothetical protein